ncbi:MAG: hypothetical protein KatS3mg090_0742 [Patescibacteria group bacterium]|nr:MAG: hypothetical protein KatS3mg090_0742 [Patescibacteria group bacterium]
MNRKTLLQTILFLLITFLILSPRPILGHSDTNNNSVDDIVSLILENQNIDNIEKINCTKVTDQEFEALGEALMDYMHPDEKEHQAMDKMMGGEGSESLKQAHILMGKRYLGCDNVPGFMGMSEMVRKKTDNIRNLNKETSERGWEHMMGAGLNAMTVPSIYGFLVFITWIAFIIFLILGSIYFWKNINKKNKH